jgi:hypothetical protein
MGPLRRRHNRCCCSYQPILPISCHGSEQFEEEIARSHLVFFDWLNFFGSYGGPPNLNLCSYESPLARASQKLCFDSIRVDCEYLSQMVLGGDKPFCLLLGNAGVLTFSSLLSWKWRYGSVPGLIRGPRMDRYKIICE